MFSEYLKTGELQGMAVRPLCWNRLACMFETG